MHWWQTRKRDADLERELQSDLELEEDEQRERGVSAEEARYAARRAFGNATLIKEHTHEAWGWAPVERLWQDVRYALRQLRRSPGFTVTSVLILALGIGAVTAVFSLIDTALLRMLPVRNPEQLVEFKSINPEFPVNDAFSMHAFKAFQSQTRTMAGVLAFRNLHNIDVEVDGRGGLAEGQLVSGSYFPVLGVNAILGRPLVPSDESEPGRNPVAVISYDYWRTRFALDPGIVGKRILLNNAPFIIVGVAAPEFYGPQPGRRIAIFIPLTMIALVNPGFAAAGGPADALKAAFRNWLYVFGRLRRGSRRESHGQPGAGLRGDDAGRGGEPGGNADRLAGSAQSFVRCRLRLDPGSRAWPCCASNLEAIVDRDGGGRAAAADYVREHRQPAAGARERESAGDFGSPRAGSGEAAADGVAADGRESCSPSPGECSAWAAGGAARRLAHGARA